MNKSELIDAMADKSELTKADAGRALDAFLQVVSETLGDSSLDVKDRSIALVGFGTFSVKERAERKGRNPKTGEEITIPKRKVASCKLSKTILN